MHTDEMMDEKMGKKSRRPAKESGIGPIVPLSLKHSIELLLKMTIEGGTLLKKRQGWLPSKATLAKEKKQEAAQQESRQSLLATGPSYHRNWYTTG
jgi:hypothetical protein